MLLVAFWQLVLILGYQVVGEFGEKGKVKIYEKSKYFNRGSISMSSESTLLQLRYDLYIMFVERVTHLWGNLGDKVKGHSPKKLNFNRGSLSMSSESTCFQLQCDPSLISVACSWTELSTSEKFWEIKKRVVHGKS